jgi:hypothetical protein
MEMTCCVSMPQGAAIGVALFGLPWRVQGVMLAGSLDYYKQQQKELTTAFCRAFPSGIASVTLCLGVALASC